MNMNRGVEQQVQEIAGQQLLKATQIQEQKLDEEIEKLDRMQEDDFEKLRRKRIQDMKNAYHKRKEWLANDHGRYMELGDQKDFFNAAKSSERLVCHFYRPSTLRCALVDKHLCKLTASHMETRFVKINAEKSPFLVEKLGIWMMPTVLLVKNGKAVHHIRGFDDMGGNDDFTTGQLADVMIAHGVIYRNDGDYEEDRRQDEGGYDSDE